MSQISRVFLSASLAAVFLVGLAQPAPAAFDKDGAKCRSQVAKNATKYAQTVAKILAGCHKTLLKEGAGDCSTVSAADDKGKASATAGKLADAVGGIKDKCPGLNPNTLLYENCPSGPGPNNCSGTITTFSDVADCLICLIDDTAAELSNAVQGAPSPASLSSDLSKCHQTIGKSWSKQLASIVKDVTGCQAKAEKAGEETVDNCTVTSFPSAKAQKAIDGTYSKVSDTCASGDLSLVDSCDTTQFALAACVRDLTTGAGQELATAAVALDGTTTTSTTSTTSTTTTTAGPTTTTTLEAADPNCPDRGELIVFAGVSSIPCSTNADCDAPRTCDDGLGLCVSISDLDTGRTGLAHDSDVNDEVVARGFLNCPGPAPTCGECQATGLDPSTDTCRCAGDNRTVCDEPFAADADDCGGGICNCYFGAPLPLSSGGTAACVINRFANQITGTANVDTGSGELTANLRSVVFLGLNGITPCPYCGGTCSGNGSVKCASDEGCTFRCESSVCVGGPLNGTGCSIDDDCSVGTCTGLDPTPNDGVRGGTCVGAGTPNEGQTCDAMSFNTTFPANGGGWHSLDCFPAVGGNVSGEGLQITLATTTGVAESITAELPCGGFFNGFDCHCRVCRTPANVDTTIGCKTNQECVDLGLKDCLGGTGALPNTCATTTNCVVGGGNNPDGVCSDRTTTYCDGFLRANGGGILACNSNADCSAVSNRAGTCSFELNTPCFAATIAGQGTPNSEFPVGVATFCVPPSASSGINGAAGLPGPGRVVQQTAATTFCYSDLGTPYEPGVGCPAP
jgi:hypothetical protein